MWAARMALLLQAMAAVLVVARSGGDALMPAEEATMLSTSGAGISDSRAHASLRQRGPGSAAYDPTMELGNSVKGRIRANMHDVLVAGRRVDAESAGAVLAAESALKARRSAAESPTQYQYSAALCEGAQVTVDLADSGFMGLLEKQLVGPGMQMRSATLPGIAPTAGSGDAEQASVFGGPSDEVPGMACVVPRAICGEGRQGALRLDVHKPMQLHGSVYCDPQKAVVGTIFVAAQDLKPQDQDLLGMAIASKDVQAAEIGQATVAEETGDGAEYQAEGKMEMIGVLASLRLGGEVGQQRVGLALSEPRAEPRARLALVKALDRLLTVVYNADREFQRTRDAAKRLSTIL